ncbi:MAG: hypothetical protein P4L16_08525 [Chlamydiales bacterium]|nr:hypothetical protein [Chlamydiales bacterium]
MHLKDCLTNEHIKLNFKSSFDLVNYAIKLAKDMIQTDRGCRVATPIQNRAYQVLLEIYEKKDFLTNYEDEDDDEE